MDALLPLAGVALVLAAWLHYLALIPREKVPRRPTGHLAFMAAGCALAAVALRHPGAASIAAFATAVGLAGFFVYLLAIATLPSPELAARVGEELPPLRAQTPEGEPFSSADIAGERVLVKLFRGHW